MKTVADSCRHLTGSAQMDCIVAQCGGRDVHGNVQDPFCVQDAKRALGLAVTGAPHVTRDKLVEWLGDLDRAHKNVVGVRTFLRNDVQNQRPRHLLVSVAFALLTRLDEYKRAYAVLLRACQSNPVEPVLCDGIVSTAGKYTANPEQQIIPEIEQLVPGYLQDLEPEWLRWLYDESVLPFVDPGQVHTIQPVPGGQTVPQVAPGLFPGTVDLTSTEARSPRVQSNALSGAVDAVGRRWMVL